MRARRTDANQQDIMDALRQIGASVQSLHKVGDGCPDIAAAYANKNLFLEIKDGNQPPSKRRLTPAESEWQKAWMGPVVTVTSVSEAVKAVMALGK